MAVAKKYPPVVVVDESDNEVGSAMLAEVWQKGLYHRVVSVYVEDDQGRMLLQFRTPSVKIYPSCWDPAAGGHVDEGCSYNRAAVTELAEELGLHNIPLKMLGTFRTNDTLDDGRIINQFERVYAVRVQHNVMLQADPEEIAELQWFTPAELKQRIAARPDQFTPGLLHGLRAYFFEPTTDR